MGKWRGNDWSTAGTSFAGLIETHWRHQSDTRNFRAMYVESGFPSRSRHDRCFRLDPCRLAHPGRAVGMPNRGSKLREGEAAVVELCMHSPLAPAAGVCSKQAGIQRGVRCKGSTGRGGEGEGEFFFFFAAAGTRSSPSQAGSPDVPTPCQNALAGSAALGGSVEIAEKSPGEKRARGDGPLLPTYLCRRRRRWAAALIPLTPPRSPPPRAFSSRPSLSTSPPVPISDPPSRSPLVHPLSPSPPIESLSRLPTTDTSFLPRAHPTLLGCHSCVRLITLGAPHHVLRQPNTRHPS
ncbi:hypothetical protein L1887_57133 [Cichorium endivia]|nr:hypothetical protein L1887_57133 [Cichorium endivia]